MATFRADRSKKPYSRPAPGRPRGVEGEWLHDKAPAARMGSTAMQGPGSSTRLLVSNLHYEMTPKDLTKIFGQIGTLVREPLIRYDRSGRSSGVAVIFFETATEATRAKNQFHGIFAKDQPMSITYDTGPPTRPRRAVSAPPLIDRIQKPPLLQRLAGNEPLKPKAPAPPIGPGPIRSRARGVVRPPRGPKKPKTAEELDTELDAFMKDDAALPTATTAQGLRDADVEMTG